MVRASLAEIELALERDGYVVVPEVLDPVDHIMPVLEGRNRVLTGIADRLASTGEIASTYEHLPFAPRLMALAADSPMRLSQPWDRPAALPLNGGQWYTKCLPRPGRGVEMTDLRDADTAPTTEPPAPALTAAQVQHFEDFGFLVLRGWMVEDLPWIESEFEAAFADESVRPDRPAPKHLAPFIDQRERLACLLEHPRVDAIATGLLGEDWNYQAGDGNLYAGETPWHRDGVWQHGRFIKVAMYLDPVDGDSGALRVVPGSHQVGADLEDSWLVPFAAEAYGLEPHEVPSVALVSTPGDVVVFSHRLLHASFGGGQRRRMFTMNLSSRARTPEQVADLQAFIALHCNQLMERMHGEIMLSTATPGRWRHLEQVIENEGILAPLTRERRAQPVTIGRL